MAWGGSCDDGVDALIEHPRDGTQVLDADNVASGQEHVSNASSVFGVCRVSCVVCPMFVSTASMINNSSAT